MRSLLLLIVRIVLIVLSGCGQVCENDIVYQTPAEFPVTIQSDMPEAEAAAEHWNEILGREVFVLVEEPEAMVYVRTFERDGFAGVVQIYASQEDHWSSAGIKVQKSAYSRNAIAHELGHLLGLADVECTGYLMSGTIEADYDDSFGWREVTQQEIDMVTQSLEREPS